MTTNQCWSRQCDGGRCEEPAAPGTYFCVGHGSRAGGVNPLAIWRASEAEMPPELVATIRRYVPEVTFPPAQPPAPAAALAPPTDAAERQPDAVSGTPSIPSPPSLRVEPDPMGWLMARLQEVMTELMASDATPLQKANAVARLGGHYLKAYRTSELKRENKELAQRAADLEQRAAAAEKRASDLESRARVWTARLGGNDTASLLLHPGPLTPVRAEARPDAANGHGSNGRTAAPAKGSRPRSS